jgi:hypothetical protein
MGSDARQQTGCSTAAIILTVVLGMALFFILLAVALAALFYTRARTEQQHAMMARERAMVEAERAMRIAEEAHAQAVAERARAEKLAADLQVESRDAIVVGIDQDGGITLNGDPTDLEGLRAKLLAAREQPVVIEVDPQCRFEHVSGVLAVCEEAEMEGVQVNATSGVPDNG